MTHTIQELRQLQAMPLNIKVSMTKNRIREWIREYGEDGVYVSFSGGKDSTVLLDIVRQEYPNVKGCFINTGLEYPEIVKFVQTFDNIDIIRPEMNFRQVIKKYGYPIFSKEVSESVSGAKKYLKSLISREREIILTDTSMTKYADTESMLNRTRGGEIVSTVKLEVLANLLNDKMVNRKRGANQRLAQVLGIFSRDKKHPIQVNIPEKDRSRYSTARYKFMLDAPFDISNYCCNVMKKNPAHKYSRVTGRKPITAQMADESKLRTQKWLENGCNAFDNKNPISNPMSFWTEQDVLLYIKEHNLPICSVYGDIVYDIGDDECVGQLSMFDMGMIPECRKLKTTGAYRTGCMFCLFGIHLEKSPNRLEQMKITHPKVYDYIMRPWEDKQIVIDPNTYEIKEVVRKGLNYREILNWINENGNFDIKF